MLVCLRVSLIMEIAFVIDCHLLENEFGENDQESRIPALFYFGMAGVCYVSIFPVVLRVVNCILPRGSALVVLA